MATASKGSKAKGGGVRFAPSQPAEGAHGHVRFDEKLHDSAVMVTQEKDGSFLVKVCRPERALPAPSHGSSPHAAGLSAGSGGFSASVPWALVAAGSGCEMGTLAGTRRCRLPLLGPGPLHRARSRPLRPSLSFGGPFLPDHEPLREHWGRSGVAWSGAI
ncbi:adipose-secreted signaling protein isoform X2 [Ciconia boyciana]|uniref:adipose-secreted signaling protein isoform X2 n=1 Tax=Ciconia boyciana TaxID=52775 RepID=UPI003B9E916C